MSKIRFIEEEKWRESLKAFRNQMDTMDVLERGSESSFGNFVFTESAETWGDFLLWVGELGGRWCFRGQREAVWPLTTPLDRAVFRRKVRENSISSYHLNRNEEENDLLFRFRQQAHRYLNHMPHTDDRASWLALMQHYGVPTRFLDWTTSPYVGMYFALEEEPARDERCSALWAIDLEWLEEQGQRLMGPPLNFRFGHDQARRAHAINEILSRRTEQGVIITVHPVIGNDRLSAQQGLFLCKLYDEAPFYGVLMRMMIKPDLTTRPVIRKLEVNADNRIAFLRQLRTMNIHRLSLFPGLDGFGRFLKLDLEMKDNG